MAEKLIITFHTTSEAMATEHACSRDQIPGRLIPVPRALSAGCGIAWMSPTEMEWRLRDLLVHQNIEWDQIARIDF